MIGTKIHISRYHIYLFSEVIKMASSAQNCICVLMVDYQSGLHGKKSVLLGLFLLWRIGSEV